MRSLIPIARGMAGRTAIPWFAEKPSHPFVPLDDPSAVARRRGQGRPSAGACALPLTAASTMARWRHSGDRACSRVACLVVLTAITVGISDVAAHAQIVPAAMQAESDPYAKSIAQAARRFGISPTWIRAIIRVESGGDRHAVLPRGAMGLMQVMPETWADIRARYGLGSDPFDPRDNILAGAAFLREMRDRYGSPGFLAAYNAGPRRYDEYRDHHQPLPPETIAYLGALRPLLGGDGAGMPILAAASDPLAWTRATIFIARSAGAQRVDHGPFGLPPTDPSAGIAMRRLSAIRPHSESLFVAVSAARSWR